MNEQAYLKQAFKIQDLKPILYGNSYLLVKTREIGQFLCDKFICWKAGVLAFIWQIKVVTYENLFF